MKTGGQARPEGTPSGAADWAGRSERGSLWVLRASAWLAVTLGRSLVRWLLHPTALYFLCTAKDVRRHSRRYLQRVLQRPATWRDLYRHFHCFASVALDRVYFVRDQGQAFEVQMQGDDGCRQTLADGQGGFLIGAHVGSFESLRAAGQSFPGMQVSMVMYPDNAQKIQGVLRALAPELAMRIIAIGQPGSTLAIREALDDGHLVGLLGDRSPPAASARGAPVQLPFLGVPAPFSDGPFRLAMLLKRRVIVMSGLFLGGRRYDIRFQTHADFRHPPADAAAREALIRQALVDYVAWLEALVRRAPYNWFNFYDFWREDEPR